MKASILTMLVLMGQTTETATGAVEEPAVDAGVMLEEAMLDEEELSAEESALLGELLDESENTFKPSLRFYGFMDFTYGAYLNGGTLWDRVLDANSDFYVGNINLYAEGNLSPQWKSLFEIRFMFLPHGREEGADFTDPRVEQRVDTTTDDYADFLRPLQWGTVEIERAYVEWAPLDVFRVRLGRFLTPYGIWNVDHGSPVVVTTRRPFVIGAEYFPERQTGLEFYGNTAAGPIQVGYHLTLSNGRGPVDTYNDLDNNKAIGGRLTFKTVALGPLSWGVSAYYGEFTDSRRIVANAGTSDQTIEPIQFESFEELSLGFDVQWQVANFLVQSELLMNQINWDDDARRFGNGAQVQPDRIQYGAYGLLGYELPWIPVMPYFLYQYVDEGAPVGFLGRNVGAQFSHVLGAGIYSRILPNVVLKAAYDWSTYPSNLADIGAQPASETPAADNFQRFEAQVAVAF